MGSLDLVPPEIRIIIYERCMEDLACTVVLYIQPSCSLHHPDDPYVIQEEIRLSTIFHPKNEKLEHPQSRKNPSSQNAFYSSLLCINQKLRREFIDHVARDLNLDVVGVGADGFCCGNCSHIEAASDLVHEPWKSRVKTITLRIDGSPLTLRKPLSCGFPALRKVILPTDSLYLGKMGICLDGVSAAIPDIDEEGLKERVSARAAKELRDWLQRYDAPMNNHSSPEWETLIKVGTTSYLFFNSQGCFCTAGEYARVSVRKCVDGHLETKWTLNEAPRADRWRGGDTKLDAYYVEI
ncbi:uncharacterized protein AB675_2910 [Cyphellophora attinorum]|uniref:Uncharacterized protein n=1 Tax=Cyphellophora attinorum TaxID=1664694 RepID=A0A0N1HJ93_9EURO|nr:uncharacterized protein AB675_2910 [Phialophora attinorum]KPI36443.1 hypothetical protein AB675_2910 [Phialophora attinorum]